MHIKHIDYYVALTAVLVGGFIMATKLSFDRQLQMTSLVMTGILYVIVGIVHHKYHHDVSHKIVVEYVLIAALGIILFSLLVTGGL